MESAEDGRKVCASLCRSLEGGSVRPSDESSQGDCKASGSAARDKGELHA